MTTEQEQETYFRNEWNDEIRLVVEINDIKYYVESYPLDQYECDTLAIRVYKDNTYSDKKEIGNGLYIDSSKGVFIGDDEIGLDDEIDSIIINKVFNELKQRRII